MNRNIMNAVALRLAMAAGLVLLTGCGGDDETTDTDYGTVQFYNASANSSLARFVVDGDLVSSASFGDATARTSLEPDDYEFTVERSSTADASVYISLVSETLNIGNGSHRLFVLTGDFAGPALSVLNYEPLEDLESGESGLLALNFSEQFGQLEVYYGVPGGDLSAASLLASLGSQGQADAVRIDADEYEFYVVDADSGETLLKTTDVDIGSLINYLVIVRDDPVNGGVALDLVSSSTYVNSFTNPTADAALRLYNSLEALGPVDLVLARGSTTYTLASVDPDTLSDALSLPYGDYLAQLQPSGHADAPYLQNRLLSLPAGGARNLLIYRSSSGAVATLLYNQDRRERVYEHDINFISLSDLRDEEGDRFPLKAYFVNEAEGETKENATQVITGIAFATVKNFTLVTGDYAVYVTYTDDDGQETLLAEVRYLSLASGTNYQLILEPDTGSYSGYRLSMR